MMRSWTDDGIDIEIGAEEELWVELQNTGGLPWVPGETFLAPTDPRDETSPLHHPSWPAPNRAATVEALVEPGDVGRFAFTVSPDSEEEITQSFGLVHEGTTWFADGPWGGGPVDDAIVLTVRGAERVDEPTGSSSGGGDDTGGGEGTTGVPEGTDGDDSDGTAPALPPPRGDADDGCGCTSASSREAAVLWLLVVLGLGRKRRTDAPPT
jgi:MYXO-CTERM domain-containing protein